VGHNRSRWGRLALVAGLVGGALVGAAPDAQACSCVGGGERAAFAEADGAFVGTFLERDEPTPPPAGTTSPPPQVEYRFRLDESVKSSFEPVVRVWSSSYGASCGFELDPGEQAGILVYRGEEGRWQGGLCSTYSPEDLRAAAKPLPAPDGRGPPAFLLAGDFGGVRAVSIDDNGRTLAYGNGRGATTHASLCPGGTVVAEVAQSGRGMPTFTVATRGVDDLGVRWERPLQLADGEWPSATACIGSAGDEVLVFVGRWLQDHGEGRILRLGRSATATAWSGPAYAASFSPDGQTAYAVMLEAGTTHAHIVNTATGTDRRIAALPRGTLSLDADPSGRRLAGTVSTYGDESSVVVVDLGGTAANPVRTVPVPELSGARVAWAGPELLVVTLEDGAVRLYDAALRTRGQWSGWRGAPVVVVGDTMYGIDGVDLVAAPVQRGPARVLSTRPGTLAWQIVPVPPPAPAPAPTTTASPPTTVAAVEPETTTPTAPEVLAAGARRRSDDDGGDGGSLLPLAVAAWLAAGAATIVVRRRRAA
jgi:hypothetical protein